VAEAGVSFGGMAPVTVTCAKAMAALSGCAWEAAAVLAAGSAALAADMPLPDAVPGGQVQRGYHEG